MSVTSYFLSTMSRLDNFYQSGGQRELLNHLLEFDSNVSKLG